MLEHIPVLIEPILNHSLRDPLWQLDKKNLHVLDCTFGRGGYSRAFLQQGCFVTAIDRDETALSAAADLKTAYPDHFTFIQSEFSKISTVAGHQAYDVILFDIGVSSPQLDDASRGFSFSKDAPLDMRMGQTGKTAADLLRTLSEKELADMFYYYGEETASRKYARLICEHRDKTPFTHTKQLADFILRFAPAGKKGHHKIHPATLVFQALRIAVNDELNEFQTALMGCLTLLKPQGRLLMVTFHSLEDRIAKQYAKNYSFMPKISKYASPDEVAAHQNYYTDLSKKPITASDQELKINPRSRSAKLRLLQRTTKIYA